MRILITRHGQTDWNVTHRLQGHTDTELNDTGKEQALKTAKLLEKEKIDLIICSPLKRTRQTAEIIRGGRDIPLIYDNRIIERGFGSLEGVDVRTFDFEELWDADKNIRLDGAESIRETYERIYAFLDDIKQRQVAENVLIVTHGGVSTAVRSYFSDIPTDINGANTILKNCEYKVYEY